MSGILKRKFEEVEVDSPSPCLSLQGSDDEVSAGSDSGNSSDSVNPGPSTPVAPSSILMCEKRLRVRNVHFESVTVYYFSRRQGFTSVPTQGGSTLGMSTRHSWVQRYTLGEFAVEQERSHRDMLRDHLKEEKLNSIKLKLTNNGTVESDEAESLTLDDISEDDIDLDNTEVDEYFFLQPMTTRRRRALLRASGVRRIDVEEKHELRAIRVSREECGCDCRGLCHPATCACSLAGIKCQVDRMSFPCGCSKEGCSNSTGRVEFNPIRVRTHFLHTIMKLELEKSREQQQQQPQVTNGNGYHGELPVNVPVQRALQYSLMSDNIPVPQAPIMHLPSASDTEQHLEEEADEDEEDDDEEYEDEDDGSSLCSGLSDCSTDSLHTSDSEEEEEEEEDDCESMEEGVSGPPVSHTEVVPLSSVLGYTDGTHTNTNRTNPNSYYHNPSTGYYQMDNSANLNPTPKAPSEAPSLPLSLPNREGATDSPTIVSQEQPKTTSEPHTDHLSQAEGQYMHFPHSDKAPVANACSSAPQQSNTPPSGETSELHHEQPFQTQTDGNDITLSLKNSTRSEVSVGTEEQQSQGSFNGLAEVSSLLPENERDPPILETNTEVTSIVSGRLAESSIETGSCDKSN